MRYSEHPYQSVARWKPTVAIEGESWGLHPGFGKFLSTLMQGPGTHVAVLEVLALIGKLACANGIWQKIPNGVYFPIRVGVTDSVSQYLVTLPNFTRVLFTLLTHTNIPNNRTARNPGGSKAGKSRDY